MQHERGITSVPPPPVCAGRTRSSATKTVPSEYCQASSIYLGEAKNLVTATCVHMPSEDGKVLLKRGKTQQMVTTVATNDLSYL